MAEFVEAILAQIVGNISTVLILLLFYFNFLLFENYLRLIIWAILFSQALRQAKNNFIEILQYLSDDPAVHKDGFLSSLVTKSCETFLRHPTGMKRSAKEMVLNYGVFVFSLIGAISMWLRVSSWMTFLNYCIGFWIVTLSLIKLLERRLFYYRYFISDEVLVSTSLILGFFITGTCVIIYLGTESYLEGSRAAVALSNWLQSNFFNDERTKQLWSEQMETSRTMIHSAITGVEHSYNETMWWPPVKSIVKTYFLDSKTGSGNGTLSTASKFYLRLCLPENMTFFQAVSYAYAKVDSVNLTSVQLSDWTSKGIEVSSIAVGSVAQLLLLICTILIAFVSLGIRAFFFISSLFYLLCTKWDPIERFVEDLLPIQNEKRPQVVHSIRKVIEGVFFVPLKMSSLHALVTLISFSIVRADFVYLATTLTFFISIVPIIPPYLVCVPWALAIGVTSSFIKALILFCVQYIAFTILDDMLYEKSIVALNSYVSALSVVFGVYVFGFEGVIFGPLSVCGVYFAYEVSNHGIQAAQDDVTRGIVATDASILDDESQEALNSLITMSSTPSNNSLTNAMFRVLNGTENRFNLQPLAESVRRRFSIDNSNGSICITLVIEGLKKPRKIRFVFDRMWSMRQMCDNIRKMLRVQSIQGIYTPDGVQVLSPKHIYQAELLHVQVLPKLHTLNKDLLSRKLARSCHSSHGVRRRSVTSGNQLFVDSSQKSSLSRRGSLKKVLQTGSFSHHSKTSGNTREAAVRL
uniref:Uncharacterized protein AlNc14C20G2090 n=1 Tax=Albugo laibachii Nc14 TaxID=890382 RepID=F0W5C4_9STRA|nr:conserved hypothetical protein [Albugo laibachii Nc14]|eukprot:CCA16315.1 conserved hypothetical protein [Albugo laibachii Nc14]